MKRNRKQSEFLFPQKFCTFSMKEKKNFLFYFYLKENQIIYVNVFFFYTEISFKRIGRYKFNFKQKRPENAREKFIRNLFMYHFKI